MQLSSGVRSKDARKAYSAVLELGRLASPRAVQLLIEALGRRDGVARSAARELGRLKVTEAVSPLFDVLADPEVRPAAADALGKMGSPAADALLAGLRAEDPNLRRVCSEVLGSLADPKAAQPLAEVVQNDTDYSVRTAAATALGQVKDPRAIWALVGVLKLRDESTPERRAALDELRQAAQLAMRRIGDPLANRQAASQQSEQNNEQPKLHPRLLGDPSRLAEQELVAVLNELIQASEEISWAKAEHREPLLPSHFTSYEMRLRTAELIGQELHQRGGKALLTQILKTQLNNHAAIRNWWSSLTAS